MFQVASHPSSFGLHAHGQYQAHTPQPLPTGIQLPRTLSRPKFTDVSRDVLHATAPELSGVPSEYIRRGLRAKANSMLGGIKSLAASHMPGSLSRSHLPATLSVPLRMSAEVPSYPTHVLAISASKSSSDQASIFPVHALILAANCALLPRLPSSDPMPAANGTLTLPVLPLALPSPAAFSVIHSYLYTHRLDGVVKALFPVPAGFLQSLSHQVIRSTLESQDILHNLSSYLFSNAGGNLNTLMAHVGHVKEVWQDLVALGLYEPELWDTLDLAWEIVLGALSMAASNQ